MRWVLAAGVSATLLGSAQAADSLGEKPIASNDPWIISVGGMMTVSPKWDGSSRYSLGGMPSISFRRASEPETFSAPDDNFDITFFTGKRFAIGPVASLRPGRSSEGGRLEGSTAIPGRWRQVSSPNSGRSRTSCGCAANCVTACAPMTASALTWGRTMCRITAS
ncbi:hypothetical protein [Mesorhizobium amorphae]|uniref:hypothetical protein n=1 Tax=Mesorhizobium amorphae TaxID=71433 RepID=UPI0021B17EE6|nr:hypothetical protein [Mesorhizobium amorphae]